MNGLPERFGKYYVLELLARGGMAEIYKVKTVGIAGFEKVQALKRILPEHAQRPRFIRSFIDEARIAVELNHRNIVQVFDFGKAEGELFLTMELIEGVDLRTAIKDAARRHVALPIALSCHVLGEVGAGLDYAHRKHDVRDRALDIVHCDVSPHNIALSHEGYVKILDFGIARAHISTESPTRRLRGKPRYMAPEQTFGDTPTPATDVFALGIIAWELMTGLPLFDDRDLNSILAAVRRAEVPAAMSLNPDLPQPLSDAIARALSATPPERGTAAELAAALRQGARTLEPGTGPRSLAAWLLRVYPPEEQEPTAITALQIPAVPPVARSIRSTSTTTDDTASTASGTLGTLTSALPLDIEDDAATGAPVALAEKRRIVAEVIAIDGSTPRTRGELRGMLADLAYKRRALVHAPEADPPVAPSQDAVEESLVVLFGLEIAGEDNVANAMSFALDAYELAREASRVTQGELALRIAARAGVVAQRRDDGYRLVGDGLDEARALARDAEPGRALLSGGAGRVTSAHFAFRDLPARRHRRRRLRVLELLGPRSFDERDRALRSRRGRFVGRQDELESMSDALAMAVRDDCRVNMALCGRAGLGKSRLVAEFVARETARSSVPPQLVAVAATPAAAMAPFSTVTELFQTALGLPPGRGEAARAALSQRLRYVLNQTSVSRAEIDETVAALDLAMEIRDGAVVSSNNPSANLHERVTAAVRRVRSAIVDGTRPLITVIEDIHLADAASVEVFRMTQLSKAAEPGQLAAEQLHPELLIVTSRDPLHVGMPGIHSLAVELSELAPNDACALIADRLAEASSNTAVRAVASRAGGNPLFIEQLSDAVREIGPDAIPASARDVVVSRVDQLPTEAKVVLQYAAVIGRTFRARILEDLLGTELYDELALLLDEEFLTRTDHAPHASDEGELGFRHGLFQEVVYQSLSITARRTTHAKLGRLLASRHRAGREEPPATIAHHLELGGERASASAYWLRAGRLALAAFDARAAVADFTRTLTIEAELDVATDPTAAATTKARRREALLGRERAHGTLGDHDAQASDLDMLEPLVLDAPRAMADLNCRRAELYSRLGDYTAAVRATERAEEAAASGGGERLRGAALRLRAEAFERQGRFDDAIGAVQRALEIFRRIGAGADETLAMIGRGRIHLIRAQYAAASAAYEPIEERVQESGDPWMQRLVHNHVAVIRLCLGQFEAAMTAAQSAVDVCRRLGDRAREGDNLSVCGAILTEVGQYDEASEYYTNALRIHEQTGSRWSRADCLCYAGTNRVRRGDPDRGIAQIEDSVSIAREIGAKYVEANALVALAGALLDRKRRTKQHLNRALAAAGKAAEAARNANLIGPEIQALSRQARGNWHDGHPDAALVLSERAMELLKSQHYVEGPEEEILFTHYRLLNDLGIAEAAPVLRRAQAELQRKLDLIESPEWRRSYICDIPLHVEIRRAVRLPD